MLYAFTSRITQVRLCFIIVVVGGSVVKPLLEEKVDRSVQLLFGVLFYLMKQLPVSRGVTVGRFHILSSSTKIDYNITTAAPLLYYVLV